ncbi:mannan endo-1,4-beta-mannosidase [Streptacidiphilus sp. MAP12-33]|uniref:glycoside hydrolase family 26 protein n=1 Tax=Streptacidiphilus sp. MAP12-33 TaxID=3156266 RepID=UPI00351908E4
MKSIHAMPRAARLGALLSVLALLLTGCALNTEPDLTGAGGQDEGVVSAPSAGGPYDVSALLDPSHKYVGAALPGIPQSLDALGPYQQEIGKKPNVLEYYASFGDGFDTSGARRIFAAGAIPYMAWEPYKPSLAAIASGSSDAYITSVAKAVASVDLPVAISFGHEFNGNWYPWGRQAATPAQFVAAWRHIHDLFKAAGATNVIWVWSPNIINPARSTRLAPYYPGDAYVDWVGVIGYYALYGEHTWNTLFEPTMREVRGFTKKPFFISETASQNSKRRLADVDDLLSGIQSHPDVLGFVWFDIVKRADWRIETTPEPLADYKLRLSNPLFGFDIRNP